MNFPSDTKFNLRQTHTFVDFIYSHLKNLILSRKLKSGQRITVKEFAEYFNVSITPVREAFQRLMAERLISINARSEIRVIGLPADEARDIFELNKALDSYGIRKNLKKFPSAVISELKKMHEDFKKYYREKNLKMMFKQSEKIHERIWREYNNRFIYQTLVRANEKISLFVGSFTERYYHQALIEKSYKDHCALMEAIEKRNGKLAAKLLAKHWDYSAVQKQKKKEEGAKKLEKK